MAQAVRAEALERAGSLLLIAGFLAALVAGSAGLAAGDPVTVILAVLVLVGYGVAGWMLVALGERSLQTAALLAVVFSLFTFGLLGGLPQEYLSGPFGHLVFFPLLVLLLSYAGGAIIGYALTDELERLEWAVRGSGKANLLLHAAAAPTIWGVFVTIDSLGGPLPQVAVSLAIAVAGTVATAAAAGGRLIKAGVHPRYTLAAGVLVLGVNAWYLLEFTNLGARVQGGLTGAQWVALLGMLLAAFPVAYSAVALYDVEMESGDALDETKPIE